MSLTPNYRFSIKKERQVSAFESGVESITRRLSSPFASRRWSGRKGDTEASVFTKSPFKMPKNKNVPGEMNGDGFGGGKGVGRGSGLSENANSSVNGTKSGSSSGYISISTSRQNKGSPETQLNFDLLDLGQYTQAARKTQQSTLETHEAFKHLSDLYAKHISEIEEVPKIHQRCSELEKLCKDKDERIRKQQNTIDTLEERRFDKEAIFEREKKLIKEQKEQLETDKKKIRELKETTEENLKARDEEWKKEKEKYREALKLEQTKKLKVLESELKQRMTKREEEIKQTLATLETCKEELSKELLEKKKQNEDQEEKLKEAYEDYEIIKRSINSFKDEKDTLKARLDTMESEFALRKQTPEFYKKEFFDISKQIEAISLQYFTELNEEDIDIIYKKLTASDICFTSVPISTSDDSRRLRIAHAQRVISSCICEVIWHPFSSEKTSSNPGFITLLSEISTELARPGQSSSGRAANAWTALTMRGLESLSSASTRIPIKPSQGNSPPPPPSRAEKFVDAVYMKLYPLIIPSQVPQVRKELRDLAESAISLWSCAQGDELKIAVSLNLDPARRSEWSSLAFDPPLPPNGNGTEVDIRSSTRPRIFALFPCVTSREVVAVDLAVGPPGSWPEPEQMPRIVETCIHPGVGLSESSALVLRGKDEEIDLREFARQEEEKFKEAVNAKRRNGGHGRSGSIGGSTSGPPSPSIVWHREGAMHLVEE